MTKALEMAFEEPSLTTEAYRGRELNFISDGIGCCSY